MGKKNSPAEYIFQFAQNQHGTKTDNIFISYNKILQNKSKAEFAYQQLTSDRAKLP